MKLLQNGEADHPVESLRIATSIFSESHSAVSILTTIFTAADFDNYFPKIW